MNLASKLPEVGVTIFTVSGAVPVYVPMAPPDFAVDWNRVADAVTAGTRAIILNFPHNPSGAVLGSGDIDALRQIAAARNLVIVSDEVCEHIVFDGKAHLSMAGDPELASRSFVIGSFAKTYHTTGWKIGYCLAPAPLSAEFQCRCSTTTGATTSCCVFVLPKKTGPSPKPGPSYA